MELGVSRFCFKIKIILNIIGYSVYIRIKIKPYLIEYIIIEVGLIVNERVCPTVKKITHYY